MLIDIRMAAVIPITMISSVFLVSIFLRYVNRVSTEKFITSKEKTVTYRIA